MMTSLFSSFDPASTLNTQLNYSVIPMSIILFPPIYWISATFSHTVSSLSQTYIHWELKKFLNFKPMGSTNWMLTIFLLILMNNLLGMIPYIYTSSSHFIFPLSFSIPLWLSFMMFKWVKTTNHMFAHLVPEGTPSLLWIFIVLIETVSNLIRPGVIALRLMANMMAGHCLMNLLWNFILKLNTQLSIHLIMGQAMLMLFEVLVSLIQAYVFYILISLSFEE